MLQRWSLNTGQALNTPAESSVVDSQGAKKPAAAGFFGAYMRPATEPASDQLIVEASKAQKLAGAGLYEQSEATTFPGVPCIMLI